MSVETIAIEPFADQKPGTSGLRKKTRDFMRAHYLESYTQAVLNATGGAAGKTYVLGGDGRYFCAQAAARIVRICAAQGAARIVIGAGAILSTPAASHLIRSARADGGFILSASHNPGGETGDFGFKFNIANGGPAPEKVTQAIEAQALALHEYRLFTGDLPAFDTPGQYTVLDTQIEIIDPVRAYADYMQELFDFDVIRDLFAQGFRFRFDALHAVTGPYAREIFETRLGAPAGSVQHAVPLPDFGGGHPDPNPIVCADLNTLAFSDAAPDLIAASDGDGDRYMILGKGAYVSPSDSLAILAANAHLVPAFHSGIKGIARSMPTSGAADRVAQKLGVETFETPTGWKFFGNLLDAGRVSLCGEESFGTGSDHIREKDGIWAVLFWLNILAVRGDSVGELLRDHWRRFGRNYYSRHDYEAVDSAVAGEIYAGLERRLAGLAGTELAGRCVTLADNFAYRDPVDGSVSEGQGLRLVLSDGARIVLRKSGTGTEGTTLRLYLEAYAPGPEGLDRDPAQALAELTQLAEDLTEIRARSGRDGPDVVT
ncbi:MAG: alpha-D-glucose phosphate-specific phosphoglucomutase [Rhodobacterales bacterium]|nr:MAG: alpha-D-glucose phosphate-specific phosphoglucomutase [Rhodobacterales bacterium]